MTTTSMTIKTPGGLLGQLDMAVDNWGGFAVSVRTSGVIIERIIQTGNASGLSFDGAKRLTVQLLDCYNTTPRNYSAYAGGDATPNEDVWLQNFICRAAPYIGPVKPGTPDQQAKERRDKSAQHCFRFHNSRRLHLGHPTRRLPVSPGHPAFGWAGYLFNDSLYPGAAIAIKEGDGAHGEYVKCGHNGENGYFGAGPLKKHLNDVNKSLAFRQNARTTNLLWENFECHVGKRFFELSAGCVDARIKNGIIWARDGACLNIEGPQTSNDKKVTWPGGSGIFDNITLRGTHLWTAASVKTGAPARCKFTCCNFTGVDGIEHRLGEHGEILN